MAALGKNIKLFVFPLTWTFFLLIFIGNIRAQDNKDKLTQDKQKIEAEIQYTSKLLEETKKSKKTSLNQLVIIKNQIASREKLIENINGEVKTVNEQMSYEHRNSYRTSA